MGGISAKHMTIKVLTDMESLFVEEKKFEKIDFTKSNLAKGEYEYCTFIHCDFSNTDLSHIKFIECEFNSCNLSLVKLVQTVFRDIEFKDCKMLGLQFENCSEFGLSFNFEGCTLNHSAFYKTKIKKTNFKNVQLQEVDFTECDLTGSTFYQCDLSKAVFANTILEKTDFRTSYNYSINPEINKLKKARFSLSSVTGLLDKYDIEVDRKS